MIQTLLNNSVWMIGLIAFLYLLVSFARKEMKRQNMNVMEYLVFLRHNLDVATHDLTLQLIIAIGLSFLISLVSFRQLWSMDVFHIVFICFILKTPAQNVMSKIFGHQ
jgi:hypothetical protein